MTRHSEMLRLPLSDATIGERPSEKEGMIDVAIVVGDDIQIYELPVDVWEEMKAQGYIDIRCSS